MWNYSNQGFSGNLNHVAVAEPEIGDGLGVNAGEWASPASATATGASARPSAAAKSAAASQAIGRRLGFCAIEHTFELLAGFRIEARDFDAGKIGGGKDQLNPKSVGRSQQGILASISLLSLLILGPTGKVLVCPLTMTSTWRVRQFCRFVSCSNEKPGQVSRADDPPPGFPPRRPIPQTNRLGNRRN